ncbi:MAG: DUF3696 domain-containing protein [Flavobacterium sp.]|nr:MAG: DUF3696 domain-containing protein [Flavobacterium sp.]
MREDLLKRFVASYAVGRDKKKDAKFKTAFNRYKKYTDSIYKKCSFKNLVINDIEDIANIASKKNNAALMMALDGVIGDIGINYDRNINAISSYRLHPDRTYLEQSRHELKVGKFGDGYLDQIILWERKNPSKFKELQDIMKSLKLLNSIELHRIEGGRYEVLVSTTANGTKNSIIDVGFGVSQFLPIIVADLQLTANSTLFVAEPEIHLHPNVQAEFGDYLVKQINTNNKNYVIETHSEYFLNRVRLAIVKGDLKEENLSVYYLENSGSDVKAHNLKFNKSGGIDNAPDGFFETYMMDLKEIAFNI